MNSFKPTHFMSNDPHDRVLRNRKCASQGTLTLAWINRSNFLNFFPCQFGFVVGHPESWWRRRTGSSLRYFVANVIGMSSKKQMIWSYAWRIVAMVKHIHSFWNGSTMQYPRQPMRKNGSIVSSSHPKLSITKRNRVGEPQPTALIIWQDEHIFPKTLFNRLGKSGCCINRIWVRNRKRPSALVFGTIEGKIVSHSKIVLLCRGLVSRMTQTHFQILHFFPQGVN